MTTRSTTTQQLTVDEQSCQGHGRCYTMSPELFDCDEEGFGVARPVELAGSDLDKAKRIVGECPERAIHIVTHSPDGKDNNGHD